MSLTTVTGRLLVCTRCSSSVDVLEAAAGATTDAEHRWINPAEFVCGECLEAAGQITRVAA